MPRAANNKSENQKFFIENKNLIIEKMKQGISVQNMAIEFGLNHMTFASLLFRNELSANKIRAKMETIYVKADNKDVALWKKRKHEIVYLAQVGYTMRGFANHYNKSERSLKAIFERLGVSLLIERAKGRKQDPKILAANSKLIKELNRLHKLVVNQNV